MSVGVLGTATGGGDASAAKQDTQSALLTSIIAALNASDASSLAKAIGLAAGSTDKATPILGVRRDSLTTLADAVGDYVPLLLSSVGALHVNLATTLSAAADSVQSIPIPGIGSFVHKSARYTTTQTGAALWTPAAGKIFVCTYCEVTWKGANDGDLVVWCSASSTSATAYTAGTDRFLVDHSPTPSTKGPGGRAVQRIFAAPASPTQIPLRVTTTGNLNCTVIVEGFEF